MNRDYRAILLAHAICCGALLLLALGIVDVTLLIGLVRRSAPLIALGVGLLAATGAYYLRWTRKRRAVPLGRPCAEKEHCDGHQL